MGLNSEGIRIRIVALCDGVLERAIQGPAKDPLGVVSAYRIVKHSHDCRLVLAGGTATDNPEGAAILSEVQEAVGVDPDVHLLLLPPTANLEINAL